MKKVTLTSVQAAKVAELIEHKLSSTKATLKREQEHLDLNRPKNVKSFTEIVEATKKRVDLLTELSNIF